jgi:hypothetical protein
MPHTPDAVPHLSRYRRPPSMAVRALPIAPAARCPRCLGRSRLQLPSFCPRSLAPDPTLPKPSQPLMRCRTIEYIAHDCDSAGRWAWWGTACCRSAKMRQARKATDRIDSYSMRKRNRARRQPCSFPVARDVAGHHHAAVPQKSDSSYSIQPPQTETFKTTGYCASIWRRQFKPHMWQCRLPYRASQGKARQEVCSTLNGELERCLYTPSLGMLIRTPHLSGSKQDMRLGAVRDRLAPKPAGLLIGRVPPSQAYQAHPVHSSQSRRARRSRYHTSTLYTPTDDA